MIYHVLEATRLPKIDCLWMSWSLLSPYHFYFYSRAPILIRLTVPRISCWLLPLATRIGTEELRALLARWLDLREPGDLLILGTSIDGLISVLISPLLTSRLVILVVAKRRS